MWFLFGILSLVTFTYYFGKKRYESNWVGIPSTVQGTKFNYKTETNKNEFQALQLGCHTTGDVTMDFSIKPETTIDRFFKAIGISVEYQVGRDSFDDDLYIISDHSAICNVLSQSTAIQNEIFAILKACKKHAIKFKELHIRNQRIWIKVTPLVKENAPNIQLIAKDVIPTLRLIADLFKTHIGHPKSSLTDPFYFKAALFLAISTGMGIMGAAHIITLYMVSEPFTIEVYELFTTSLILGSAVTGGLIFMMFLFLGRTARTHLVLLELITIGYFGAVASTFCLARDINIEWDSASPKQYIVEVHNKTLHRGRKHTSYYLHVDDWLNPGQQKRLSVSGSKYRDINIGEKLEVDQYPGFLGFKWVDELKKYSPDY